MDSLSCVTYILVKMWNVKFADQIAMILNIDVRDTLDAVRAVST